jgi:hypothetical protein
MSNATHDACGGCFLGKIGPVVNFKRLALARVDGAAPNKTYTGNRYTWLDDSIDEYWSVFFG